LASLKAFSLVSVGIALIVSGTEKTATAATFNDAPLFKDVASYTTTISANNNLADIYFPNPKNLKTGKYSFPIALLLQGALVDKSNYSNYASIVASYGFIVVVPNSERLVPKFGKVLAPQTSQVNAVLTQMLVENSNPTSPVRGIVNTQKLGLLGHSLGGSAGLSAIANLCVPIVCEGSFSRPKKVVAGAFFGANLRDENDELIPINNSRIPIALLQGTVDGRALPFRAQATYDNIKDPPKALISILGTNHFGITNTNNPLGAVPDPNNPTIEQNVAVETIARWSGLFLRASVLDDKGAFDYIYSTGYALDPKVTVISQTKPIPKGSST
jgi:dienelactone hydrolase